MFSFFPPSAETFNFNLLTHPTEDIPIRSTNNTPWSPSTPPSIPLASPETPETPPSVGSVGRSGDDADYSPPIASAMLPSEPQTLGLMILTEYLTAMFKQAGKNGQRLRPEHADTMHQFIGLGNYSREDLNAALMHAIGIVCKVQLALRRAERETGGCAELASMEVAMESGFGDAIKWEDLTVENVEQAKRNWVRLAIVRCYEYVAAMKVGMVELFERQAKAQAMAETSGEDWIDEKMNVDEDGGYNDADHGSLTVEYPTMMDIG